ncbi:MAG: hypothetical protein KY428_05385 [Bacteroidetes bacterium]|nr:hypothetical protein [Bacteroidota bacterium]
MFGRIAVAATSQTVYSMQHSNSLSMLNELARQELSLQRLVYHASGTAAAINSSLQQQGVFAAYRQIHRAYVQLASFKQERHTRNEALKRAIFLNWYSQLEPAALTGLADLDESQITEAYFILNKIIEKSWLTDEQAWMLQHYAYWDWAILQYTENKIHALSRWVMAASGTLAPLPPPAVLQQSMQGRGLMGLYFLEKGLEAAANQATPPV